MRRPVGAMAVALCCVGVLAGRMAAGDWAQWRGPNRDGAIPGFAVPKTWPKELKRHWQIEVGTGHSSPLVAGDRVFLLSREGDNEVVRAVALAEGKQLWSQSYAAPFTMSPYATSHGKGPKSTPVVAGGRLFTLGIGNIVSCWDAESGKQLWQRDFSKKYTKGSAVWYGASMSPLVDGQSLIAMVGGCDEGALVALDCASGDTRWQWEGDGAAYASPMIATLGGTRQIVTQSQNRCIGVSAADGALLWSIPLKTDYDQNIVTPIIAGELVIFGGLGHPTTAWRLRQAGGKWTPEKAWENEDMSLYMCTPILVGDRLVALAKAKKGFFCCVEATSGKTLWSSDGRIGDYATLLTAGGLVLAQTNGGELMVFDPRAERFEPVARYKVADKPTWAHPAFAGNRILVKDENALTLWTVE